MILSELRRVHGWLVELGFACHSSGSRFTLLAIALSVQ